MKLKGDSLDNLSIGSSFEAPFPRVAGLLLGAEFTEGHASRLFCGVLVRDLIKRRGSKLVLLFPRSAVDDMSFIIVVSLSVR